MITENLTNYWDKLNELETIDERLTALENDFSEAQHAIGQAFKAAQRDANKIDLALRGVGSRRELTPYQLERYTKLSTIINQFSSIKNFMANMGYCD